MSVIGQFWDESTHIDNTPDPHVFFAYGQTPYIGKIAFL